MRHYKTTSTTLPLPSLLHNATIRSSTSIVPLTLSNKNNIVNLVVFWSIKLKSDSQTHEIIS